jgi:hypothetical protein
LVGLRPLLCRLAGDEGLLVVQLVQRLRWAAPQHCSTSARALMSCIGSVSDYRAFDGTSTIAHTGDGAPIAPPTPRRRVGAARRASARDDAALPMHEALTVLLGLVGHRVDVAIESPAAGLIAHFSGELAQGHELAADEAAPGPLFFSFDDGASGFVVNADAVVNATPSLEGSSVRIEDRAGVAIIVERASPSHGGDVA